MSARSVVVVMPFGGRDQVERRRAILNFKRLEYIVRTKCEVSASGGAGASDRIVYAVEVARTAMDEIPDKALKQIAAADIVIALVAEHNPNVIYEVAFRRTRDRTVLLVVDSADNLPVYLTSVAHQNWRQDKVLARIDTMATDRDSLPRLPDFNVGIPAELKDTIDAFDVELIHGLEAALREIELTFRPPQVDAVQNLRGIVSAETTSFYPCSIVEVAFARRGEFADPQHPGPVTDFDASFSQLYGYADKNAADVDRPLTLGKLLQRLKPFSDTTDWNLFMSEQIALTETVIKNYNFARATIPVRFNGELQHPHRAYRETSFLPCIVAQVIDPPDLDTPHTMYLLVVYIELPGTLKVERSSA